MLNLNWGVFTVMNILIISNILIVYSDGSVLHLNATVRKHRHGNSEYFVELFQKDVHIWAHRTHHF